MAQAAQTPTPAPAPPPDALAVRADASDTALMVLGPDEGMALATKLNLAVLFFERTGDGFTERATPRFEEIASKR